MGQTVTVEVAGPHNECHNFKPTDETLVGRVNAIELRYRSMNGRFNSLPDVIPGVRIHIDYDAKSASIEDPVCNDENMQAQVRGFRSIRRNTKHDLRGENDLATWHHWTKRLVGDGYGRIIDGRFPEKVIGKPRINIGGFGTLPPGEDVYGEARPPQWFLDQQRLSASASGSRAPAP